MLLSVLPVGFRSIFSLQRSWAAYAFSFVVCATGKHHLMLTKTSLSFVLCPFNCLLRLQTHSSWRQFFPCWFPPVLFTVALNAFQFMGLLWLFCAAFSCFVSFIDSPVLESSLNIG